MAKDYFQDILPPDEGKRKVSVQPKQVARDLDIKPQTIVDESDDDIRTEDVDPNREPTPERSIRNIAAPQRRSRDTFRDDMQDAPRFSPPMNTPRRRVGRVWMWVAAVVALLVIGVLLLVALRGTSVTVEPRSHTVVFDETSRLLAYPASTAATGTLTYTTQVLELEDSEPVESTGTVQAEEKASGVVIVYNDFSASPFRLVKNTRFESPTGLIYRAPADIVIPGRVGTTPGQITVTVVADQAGESYNIPPSRLTVPGLKGGAEYSKIYAQSSATMSGGFKGTRPGIAEGDLAGAKALVRGRLEKKVIESVRALSNDQVTVFAELAQIEYQDMPTTQEGGGARINQKAVVTVPLLPSGALAQSVARTVSADAENNPVALRGIRDFGGMPVSASSTLGTDPLQFGLTGQAILIWHVDADALAQALAGRDQSAFQTIVTGFPGIQSATARIEPFWSDSFPSEASRIRVKISDPAPEN